jgi:DNA repair protein RadC
VTTYPTIPIKEIEIEERPQERLLRLGPAALSDSELLAMILRSGTKGTNVIVLAKKILQEAGSLHNLTKYRLEDFKKINGIGQVKGLQLISIIELCTRIASPSEKQLLLNTPKKIYQFFEKKTMKLDIEKVWVLCLNRKNYLINSYENHLRNCHQFFDSSQRGFQSSNSLRLYRNNRSAQSP